MNRFDYNLTENDSVMVDINSGKFVSYIHRNSFCLQPDEKYFYVSVKTFDYGITLEFFLSPDEDSHKSNRIFVLGN